jgi:proteasome beta subunit
MNENEVLNTGTTTIGIMCKDCVVMAADKRATAGHLIANKMMDKVIPINDSMVLTTAGTVSDIQLLIKLLKAELNLKSIRVERKPTVKEAANLMTNIIYNNIRKMSMIPGITHFLLGGFDKEVKLYDLYADGSISDIDDFVASGSGSVIAYGLLEATYKKDMTEAEGVEMAIKAVNAALQRDSASGGGIDVFVVDKNGVKKAASKIVNSRAE